MKRYLLVYVVAILSGGCGGGSNDILSDSLPDTIPEPVLSLSADSTTLPMGGEITLSWVANNVDSCTASGGWSGLQPIEGSLTLSGIVVDTDYVLRCTGAGGSVEKSVSVTIAAAGAVVSGSVDSSYIDRMAANAIYIYSGNVVPDDRDGDDGDPLMVVAVKPVLNSCTWSYTIPDLPAGEYTFAFTREVAGDDPLVNDTINFSKVLNRSITGAGQVINFSANRIIRVGPSRTYKTISEAYVAASDGDVIEVDAGVYPDDIVVWRKNDLTIRGVGGRAHVQATRKIEYQSGSDTKNGKGIWVVRGANVRVENMEFSGASVDGNNGAGIRVEGPDLQICNSYFHDNENGILGGDAGYLYVEYSEFFNNGYGDGYSHNMYISSGTEIFILKHSYSHHAKVGHNVKTRAQSNYLLYNRIMDEETGTASYAIDIPNGGASYLIGNLVQQGINSGNSTMIAYGAEGLRAGRTHQLYLVNNTLVNDRGRGTFVSIRSGTEVARLINNIILGGGSVLSGSAEMITNAVTTDSSILVDRNAFDYHAANSSIIVDAGTEPGSVKGYSLTPIYQYVADAKSEHRQKRGTTLDIGAFEYLD